MPKIAALLTQLAMTKYMVGELVEPWLMHLGKLGNRLPNHD